MSAQAVMPEASKVSVKTVSTSMRELAKNNTEGIKRSDRYRVDPRLLYIQDGFNIRITSTPESRANIDSLKLTIRDLITKEDEENRSWSEGFLSIFPEIKAFVNKEGKLQVYDGYHRTIALHELLAEGFEIDYVHVDARQMSDAEVIMAMVRSSMGLKHTPLERAIAFTRLADECGMTLTEIARQSGEVTVQRVEQLLLLGRADAEIRQYVADKKITADAAIEMLRKHREGALEVIRGMVNGKSCAGRVQTRPSITKGVQEKMFAAMNGSSQQLAQKIEALKQKGEGWKEKPVAVELPAEVVAEILKRMGA